MTGVEVTPLRNATVYVVMTAQSEDDLDGPFDLEVLDEAPRWRRLSGQVCYVANVNGGDSIEWTGWTTEDE